LPATADAIVDGVSGVLVDNDKALAAALERVLRDDAFRALLAKNALEYATRFTWAATARGTLEVLAAEALRHRTGVSGLLESRRRRAALGYSCSRCSRTSRRC